MLSSNNFYHKYKINQRNLNARFDVLSYFKLQVDGLRTESSKRFREQHQTKNGRGDPHTAFVQTFLVPACSSSRAVRSKAIWPRRAHRTPSKQNCYRILKDTVQEMSPESHRGERHVSKSCFRHLLTHTSPNIKSFKMLDELKKRKSCLQAQILKEKFLQNSGWFPQGRTKPSETLYERMVDVSCWKWSNLQKREIFIAALSSLELC